MKEQTRGQYRLEDSAGTVFVYGPRKAEPYRFTEQEACRLLVFGPDLLAALERLLHETDEGTQLCAREVAEAARAAVAKARGG